MFVMRVMKSAHTVRISIPRLVQRHLGIRAGDCLVMDTAPDGRAWFRKLTTEELSSGKVSYPTPVGD